MTLSRQSPLHSGAVPPSLSLLIINNLQINRTAYITSLAAPWSIPGMSLKLCLMNLHSVAVVRGQSTEASKLMTLMQFFFFSLIITGGRLGIVIWIFNKRHAVCVCVCVCVCVLGGGGVINRTCRTMWKELLFHLYIFSIFGGGETANRVSDELKNTSCQEITHPRCEWEILEPVRSDTLPPFLILIRVISVDVEQKKKKGSADKVGFINQWCQLGPFYSLPWKSLRALTL